MNILTRTSLCTLLAGFAAGATYAGNFAVTSPADDGAGSLRAAIEAANSTEGDHIIIVQTRDDIEISAPLSYSGAGKLSIFGDGQTISTAQDHTLLEVLSGADLTLSQLNFEGPGDFSIENRGDGDGQAGKGIFVKVTPDQTGTVSLTLNDVRVADVANHGVHVSDCDLADDCGGGSGGAGGGSDASIRVFLNEVTIERAGHGKFDADGLRVDERGDGDITAILLNSTFTRVGADGVELDEGQAGDVIVRAIRSAFTENGDYCDPELLESFMPDVPEAEFDEGAVQEDAIPPAVEGAPDNSCIERSVDLYDDGTVEEYEFEIDVDDAFDVDEAGEGSIIAQITSAVITGNFDEGLDFDEEDAGNIQMTILGSEASDNTDDGFKHSEEGEGSVIFFVANSSSTENGGKGFVFEEEDGGDVNGSVIGVSTADNDDSDDTGLKLVQEDSGLGAVTVAASDIADGIDAEGIDLVE